MYKHVIPNYADWQLYKMGLQRDQLVDAVTQRTLERLKRKNVLEELEKTSYGEQQRIRYNSWPVDPPDEDVYWRQIKNQIYNLSIAEKNTAKQHEILEKIIRNYAEEIIGRFNPNTHKFARLALPFFFSQVLNAASGYNIRDFFGRKNQLYQKIKVCGHVSEARNLADKATLLLLPTHFSNLDSILIGWAMDMIGLPPFIYGAGLNLFNNRLVGYFMSRLGAYRVDRRKKNDVYLETLKAFSAVAFEQGAHTLFFPGGTRNRVGAIEEKLKLGLLGTAFEAQKMHCKNNEQNPRKIIVFPLVISYNNVLEAKSLIDDYLKSTGKEKYYIRNDETESFTSSLKFVWKFFRSSSEIYLNLGEPFDLFGNKVNEQGESIDPSGNIIHVGDYFKKDGNIVNDNQRDAQYNITLGNIVVQRLLSENIVLPSHLVAFVMFKILEKKHKHHDLYDTLRLTREYRIVKREEFHSTFEIILQRLKQMQENNRLHLENTFKKSTEEIIEEGIQKLNVFHLEKPVKRNENNDFTSDSMNLLYYYHNRLMGYQLENLI